MFSICFIQFNETKRKSFGRDTVRTKCDVWKDIIRRSRVFIRRAMNISDVIMSMRGTRLCINLICVLYRINQYAFRNVCLRFVGIFVRNIFYTIFYALESKGYVNNFFLFQMVKNVYFYINYMYWEDYFYSMFNERFFSFSVDITYIKEEIAPYILHYKQI